MKTGGPQGTSRAAGSESPRPRTPGGGRALARYQAGTQLAADAGGASGVDVAQDMAAGVQGGIESAGSEVGFPVRSSRSRSHTHTSWGRLDDLRTARKVVADITAPGDEPQLAEAPDTYQRLVAHFNDHPSQPFRARELHEFLGLPTDEASVNTTRSRLGRLVRQSVLTQPGRGIYQKRA